MKLCDQNWWNIIKKNRYEFSSASPNMVQRLFADVIHTFSISFIHIIEFLMNIWWPLILIQSQIIIWSYVIKTDEILLKKIDTSFHQRLQIWFNVYLLTSYMTRFGLWICMSKSTHDFWLCHTRGEHAYKTLHHRSGSNFRPVTSLHR